MFNFACSDENKDSYLRLKHTNIGGSSISEVNHIRDHSIKLFKLDDFLKDNIIEIGLIKIDVEGHEIEVIKGLDFKIYKPKLITVEIHAKKTNEVLKSNVYKYLTKNNYELISQYYQTSFFKIKNFDPF